MLIMEGVSLVQCSAHTIQPILTELIVLQSTQNPSFKDNVMEEEPARLPDHIESLGTHALVPTNTLKWNLTASKILPQGPHP